MRPLTHIGLNTRTNWKVTRLYKLARRTLVASIMCLSVSFINVLCVVMTHGHQRGLICLTMCTVDVTVKKKKKSKKAAVLQQTDTYSYKGQCGHCSLGNCR